MARNSFGHLSLQWHFLACLVVCSIVLTGCSANRAITNLEDVAGGKSYQAEYRARTDTATITPVSAPINLSRCLASAPEGKTRLFAPELLSPGDLVDVAVGNDDTFSGKYEISSDGTLKIRDLVSVMAFGRTAAEVGNAVTRALMQSHYYTQAPPVSVRLADYGVVRVYVGGAVFEPGVVTIGGTAATADDSSRVQAVGAVAITRRLSRALQSAGGIRPDADLSRVVLKRNGAVQLFDLRKVITGGMFDDIVMLAGDEVTVPSLSCFQSTLMVPSAISPPGVKVFMSNLTEPSPSNANSSINKDAREMKYGTRMLQAIVGMNCVGGSKLTNASRSAVLYSRNPVSGKSIVIERNIEELLRNGNRDDYDPFLLPDDALACYDSMTTDVVKIAQSFGIVAGAIVVGRGL